MMQKEVQLIVDLINDRIKRDLSKLPTDLKIDCLNKIREFMHHEVSPFKNEPVDMVKSCSQG